MDSNTNEEASHGSVTYSIRPVNNVPLTTVISNTAAIYFDFNQAVNTNTITSYVDIIVSVKENLRNSFSIVPNPSSNNIRVLLNDELKNNTCTLIIFNLQGQEMMHVDDVNNHSTISLEQLARGCYFYRLEKDGRIVDHIQGKIILNR